MKKVLFVVFLLVVALVGFRLGRGSLSAFVSGDSGEGPVNESYPLLPPPPESQPYVPGMPAEPEGGGIPVVLETPLEGASVVPPFDVSGRALSDQGQLLVSIVGPDDREVYSRRLDIVPESGSKYGRFELSVGNVGQAGDFILEVSLVDSDDEDAVQTRQISFGQPEDADLQVFFSNPQLDPWEDCTKVFSVTRSVSSRGNVFRSVLEELLSGPDETESGVGYASQIPDGAKVKSVGIDASGQVTVDFDRRLERGVAGSCRVLAIRSQVESTLRQFPEVKSVVITVEGEEEGVLQP